MDWHKKLRRAREKAISAGIPVELASFATQPDWQDEELLVALQRATRGDKDALSDIEEAMYEWEESLMEEVVV